MISSADRDFDRSYDSEIRLAPVGPGRRALARLMDMTMFFLPMIPILSRYGAPVGDGTLKITSDSVISAALLMGLWGGYDVLLTSTWGSTLGKGAMNIVVVSRRDGTPPSPGAAFVRWLMIWGSYVLKPLLLLLWISLWFDRSGYQRGWHDKVAGTVVLNRAREAEGSVWREAL